MFLLFLIVSIYEGRGEAINTPLTLIIKKPPTKRGNGVLPLKRGGGDFLHLKPGILGDLTGSGDRENSRNYTNLLFILRSKENLFEN